MISKFRHFTAMEAVVLISIMLHKMVATLETTPINKSTLETKDEDINRNDNVTARFRKKYTPSWADLDTRPLPRWYDASKIGIFVHWGVYSVTSYSNEWFWNDWKNGNYLIQDFLQRNGYSGMKYQDFAPMFRAENFDPDEWAELFASSGAKFVVLTTKHHDGFTLFPSMRTNWNSLDVGPRLDIVSILADAVRKAGLRFGVYYSLFEWFNKLFVNDRNMGFNTSIYVDEIVIPDIKLLINDYKPSVLWSDGEWEANATYWKSEEILAWLYNESPVRDEIVVNDRWGKEVRCFHGDFHNCDDRYNPEKLQKHKWENAFTIDKRSWGFRRDMRDEETLTTSELLKQVVSTISCGGNVLINVGPTKEGTIPDIFKDRLTQLGKWLQVNGEAIYNTSPWLSQRDWYNKDVWYTCHRKEYDPYDPTGLPRDSSVVSAIFAIFLKWPLGGDLLLRDIYEYMTFTKEEFTIELIKNGSTVSCKHTVVRTENGTLLFAISLPAYHTTDSQYGWVLKFRPSSQEFVKSLLIRNRYEFV